MLKKAFIFGLTLAVLSPIIWAASSMQNLIISGEVIGNKPVVYSFSPTTGSNDVPTPITAIVGRNFTSAFVVTLDDPGSTAMTGTLTVSTSCDNNPANVICGSGTYDKITGLSVPAGIIAGDYNVLVTGPTGTNIGSDIPFAVTNPPPGPNARIDSINPDPIVIEVLASQDVTMEVSDSNSPTVAYSAEENGGTWDVPTGLIAMVTTTETQTLEFTAGAIPSPYANIFRVDDDGETIVDNDDSQSVDFYVQPIW